MEQDKQLPSKFVLVK